MLNRNSVLLSTIFVAFGLSNFAMAQSPKIVIEKVRAYGTGCKSDVNGKPTDSATTINTKRDTFATDFSEFIVTKKEKKSCKVSLIVAFPAGRTLYSFKAQVRGDALVEEGEKGSVETKVRLGKDRFKEVHVIPAGTDDDFETKAYEFKSKKNAPCGGKDYRIDIEVTSSIDGGKDAFLGVASVEGMLADMQFKTNGCK